MFICITSLRIIFKLILNQYLVYPIVVINLHTGLVSVAVIWTSFCEGKSSSKINSQETHFAINFILANQSGK